VAEVSALQWLQLPRLTILSFVNIFYLEQVCCHRT